MLLTGAVLIIVPAVSSSNSGATSPRSKMQCLSRPLSSPRWAFVLLRKLIWDVCLGMRSANQSRVPCKVKPPSDPQLLLWHSQHHAASQMDSSLTSFAGNKRCDPESVIQSCRSSPSEVITGRSAVLRRGSEVNDHRSLLSFSWHHTEWSPDFRKRSNSVTTGNIWQIGGRDSAVRVGRPIIWRLVVQIHSHSSKKRLVNWQLEGWQFTSLSRLRCPWARHRTPMLPRRCEWLPTAPVYGTCLHECVTLCMCVSTGTNLDGLKAEDKFHMYAWQINLILILNSYRGQLYNSNSN